MTTVSVAFCQIRPFVRLLLRTMAAVHARKTAALSRGQAPRFFMDAFKLLGKMVEFFLMLDGFRGEEMNGFLRFGELDAQAGKLSIQSVKPLIHFGAELLQFRSEFGAKLVGHILHFHPKLIGGVLDFRPKQVAHLVNLGTDVVGKTFQRLFNLFHNRIALHSCPFLVFLIIIPWRKESGNERK
ncbi:hypothetical protein [Geobacillus sp. G4]|uniref:hypothetical protein n=1 Tax=Geobacillus sp. G4 TaxID=3169691 RepID=UPI00387EE74C